VCRKSFLRAASQMGLRTLYTFNDQGPPELLLMGVLSVVGRVRMGR
jgi:hypothetical protein